MKHAAFRSLVAITATAALLVAVLPATLSSATVGVMVPSSLRVTAANPDTGCFFAGSESHPTSDITVTYTLIAPHGTATISEFTSRCATPLEVVSADGRTVHGSDTVPPGTNFRITVSNGAKALVRFALAR